MFILLIATLFILLRMLKYDAFWIRLRIEMFLAMFGIVYKPSKLVCFIFATAMFYIVYWLIFKR